MKKFAGNRLMLIVLSILLIFALCVSLVSFLTFFRANEKNADNYSAALIYIFEPVSEMLDAHYLSVIDAPMEALQSSTPFISYSFTTRQYPAGNELITRLGADLQKLCDSSSAISGAFVYATTSDSYVASPSLLAENSPLSEGAVGIRNIIYSYNSGTLKKSQVSQTEHLTFLFQYQDHLVVAKDLTTLSGQAYSTIFLILDMADFASYLFESNTLNAHYHDHIDIGIFDDGGSLLYSSDTLNMDAANEALWKAADGSEVLRLGDAYGVSFRSDVLNWRYVFVIDRGFLSPLANPVSNLSLLLTNLGISLAMAAAIVLLIRRWTHPVDQSIAELTQRLGLQGPIRLLKRPNSFDQIGEKLSERLTESEELKSVLSSISDEALSMLFFRMLSGAQVDRCSLENALRFADYGFSLDDVYVAGVADYRDSAHISLETRQEINDFLSRTLQRFGEKHNCRTHTLTLDAPCFALVFSFPADVPIAKCKHILNELVRTLTSAIEAKGYPIVIRFGHLYHSIHDLAFSYHEAVKLLPSREDVPIPSETDEVIPEPAPTDEAAEESGDESEADTLPDYLGFIDRRAAQIVQSVLEGKQEVVPQILDRTLRAIFTQMEPDKRPEYVMRLVNGITEAMIGNRFVVHEHLTDVSGALAENIEEGMTSDQLIEETRQGVYTLCADLDRILEKQRNPYITAALQYIDAHYSNPDLSLEEIAESLGIAPNYISSLFRKNLGKKMFEYVNEIRLEKAMEMLTNTQLSVNEICEKSGFGSPRNFMRQFKKYTDMTPTAYRKQRQGVSETKETEE